MLAVRFLLVVCIAVMLGLVAAPVNAWVYDGGEPTISGPPLRDGTSTVWAAQPFKATEDCYVTRLGAAVSRMFGNTGMGFDILLTDREYDGTFAAMASGTLYPTTASYTYLYSDMAAPVRLNAGETYYVTLMPNTNNFAGSVCWSYKVDAMKGRITADYGQNWYDAVLKFGVRVDGYTAVPEPATWLAVAMGAMGTAGIALRRRFGSRAEADRA